MPARRRCSWPMASRSSRCSTPGCCARRSTSTGRISSSGKGQSMVRTAEELDRAWDYAVANMRGDRRRVIVEAFVDFDYEITLLTIRARDGVHFCPPIGHRQERGDYQESWQPTPMSDKALATAKEMARKVVDDLGGHGIFGVEFFVKGEEVIFSE